MPSASAGGSFLLSSSLISDYFADRIGAGGNYRNSRCHGLRYGESRNPRPRSTGRRTAER